MLLKNSTNNSGVGVGEMEMRIRADSKSFIALSSGLYSKPIEAIVRELTSNAIDGSKMANIEKPVEITLPNVLSVPFSVQDFGVGMSFFTVTEVYGVYFTSTKEQNENQIGGFGLGGKTPFTYTNEFTLETTSPEDNVRRTFHFRMVNGMPSMNHLEHLDVANSPIKGTKVSFFLKSMDDVVSFRKALKEVIFHDYPILILENGTNIKDEILKSYRLKDMDKILSSLNEKGVYIQFADEQHHPIFTKDLTSGFQNRLTLGENETIYIRCNGIVYAYPLSKVFDKNDETENPENDLRYLFKKYIELYKINVFLSKADQYLSKSTLQSMFESLRNHTPNLLLVLDSKQSGEVELEVSRENIRDTSENSDWIEKKLIEVLNNLIEKEKNIDEKYQGFLNIMTTHHNELLPVYATVLRWIKVFNRDNNFDNEFRDFLNECKQQMLNRLMSFEYLQGYMTSAYLIKDLNDNDKKFSELDKVKINDKLALDGYYLNADEKEKFIDDLAEMYETSYFVRFYGVTLPENQNTGFFVPKNEYFAKKVDNDSKFKLMGILTTAKNFFSINFDLDDFEREHKTPVKIKNPEKTENAVKIKKDYSRDLNQEYNIQAKDKTSELNDFLKNDVTEIQSNINYLQNNACFLYDNRHFIYANDTNNYYYRKDRLHIFESIIVPRFVKKYHKNDLLGKIENQLCDMLVGYKQHSKRLISLYSDYRMFDFNSYCICENDILPEHIKNMEYPVLQQVQNYVNNAVCAFSHFMKEYNFDLNQFCQFIAEKMTHPILSALSCHVKDDDVIYEFIANKFIIGSDIESLTQHFNSFKNANLQEMNVKAQGIFKHFQNYCDKYDIRKQFELIVVCQKMFNLQKFLNNLIDDKMYQECNNDKLAETIKDEVFKNTECEILFERTLNNALNFFVKDFQNFSNPANSVFSKKEIAYLLSIGMK